MNENYSEYAVEVRQTAEMRGKQAASVIVTAAAVFLALNVHWMFLAAVAAGAVWCYFSWLSSSLEYETIFLDGTLEIAAVYRKMRRKVKLQCEMKNISSYYLGTKAEAGRMGRITRDFSSRREDAVCCVMKVGTPKGEHVVCFEPGEELERILNSRYRLQKI